MAKHLNISVSGGAVNIGTVIQSDETSVKSGDILSKGADFELVSKDILQKMSRNGFDETQIALVSDRLKEVKSGVDKNDKDSIWSSIKEIGEICEWAVPLVQKSVAMFGFV